MTVREQHTGWQVQSLRLNRDPKCPCFGAHRVWEWGEVGPTLGLERSPVLRRRHTPLREPSPSGHGCHMSRLLSDAASCGPSERAAVARLALLLSFTFGDEHEEPGTETDRQTLGENFMSS